MAAEEQTFSMFGIPRLVKRWDVSRDTIIRAIARGEIRTVCFSGRRMVPASEVQRIELVGFGPGRKRSKKAAQ
jgi:hypothetical protein